MIFYGDCQSLSVHQCVHETQRQQTSIMVPSTAMLHSTSAWEHPNKSCVGRYNTCASAHFSQHSCDVSCLRVCAFKRSTQRDDSRSLPSLHSSIGTWRPNPCWKRDGLPAVASGHGFESGGHAQGVLWLHCHAKSGYGSPLGGNRPNRPSHEPSKNSCKCEQECG